VRAWPELRTNVRGLQFIFVSGLSFYYVLIYYIFYLDSFVIHMGEYVLHMVRIFTCMCFIKVAILSLHVTSYTGIDGHSNGCTDRRPYKRRVTGSILLG
jgi:hypothetical protein